MTVARKRLVLGMLALVMLSACGGKRAVTLRDSGPDEFSVLPSRPLELPEDYAALPEPLRGAPNRADPRPRADAVAALGGNPAELSPDGVAPADQGVVSAASRYGVDPGIRGVLAAEDQNARPRKQRRRRVMSRSLRAKRKAYRKMALDAYAENERFRRLGIGTPSAPPAGLR